MELPSSYCSQTFYLDTIVEFPRQRNHRRERIFKVLSSPIVHLYNKSLSSRSTFPPTSSSPTMYPPHPHPHPNPNLHSPYIKTLSVSKPPRSSTPSLPTSFSNHQPPHPYFQTLRPLLPNLNSSPLPPDLPSSTIPTPTPPQSHNSPLPSRDINTDTTSAFRVSVPATAAARVHKADWRFFLVRLSGGSVGGWGLDLFAWEQGVGGEGERGCKFDGCVKKVV